MSSEDDLPPRKPGRIRGFVKRRQTALAKVANPSLGMDQQKRPIRLSETGGVFAGMFHVMKLAGALIFRWIKPTEEDWSRTGLPFSEVAKTWGLTKENIHRVRRGLRMEQFLFGVMTIFGVSQVIYGFVLADDSFWQMLSRIVLGGMLTVAGIILMAIASWRLDVIGQKRYRPFAIWMRGG